MTTVDIALPRRQHEIIDTVREQFRSPSQPATTRLTPAERTAATAVLAAQRIHRGVGLSCLGLVGAGPVNQRVLDYMLAAGPPLESVLVHDSDEDRAEAFRQRCDAPIPVRVAVDIYHVLASSDLISLATGAAKPSVTSLALCQPGATILHLSLCDLAAHVIAEADNVVEDPDTVCRDHTSLAIAEKQTTGRGFIRCTLGDVLRGRHPARRSATEPVIFSAASP